MDPVTQIIRAGAEAGVILEFDGVANGATYPPNEPIYALLQLPDGMQFVTAAPTDGGDIIKLPSPVLRERSETLSINNESGLSHSLKYKPAGEVTIVFFGNTPKYDVGALRSGILQVDAADQKLPAKCTIVYKTQFIQLRHNPAYLDPGIDDYPFDYLVTVR